MITKVLVRPRPDRDLDELALYIAENNLEAGKRFYDAVEKALQRISQMPQVGHRYSSERSSGEDELRVWPVSGFESILVFYRVRKDVIDVVRVLHGARDIRRLLNL